MRHKVAHRKLGRTSEHRKSLLRNLCTSLIVNERLVRLRAERAGTGSGRIYTITLTCGDAAGNVSAQTATAAVRR